MTPGDPQSKKMDPRATKMHQKIDLRKRFRKGRQKALRVIVIWSGFGSHFPLKTHPKIDAKLDTEQVV